MSCKKSERDIYLYNELNSKEKRNIDQHLQQCDACRKLLQEVQTQLSALHEIAPAKAQLKNPDRLTRHIMQAIESEQKSKWTNLFASLFDNAVPRYALGAVSVFLIVFFITEQSWPSESNTPVYVINTFSKRDVPLNSFSFLKKNVEKNKEPKRRTFTSLYACALSNDCDNPLIKKFKHKKNTQ